MKSRFVFIFIYCLLIKHIYSQEKIGNWQLGISGRLTIDILANKKTCLWYNWRFAVSTSAAYLTKVHVDWNYMPSAHLDLVLMQGGIGTKDVDELRAGLKKSFSRQPNGFVCLTIHPVQVGLINKSNSTDRNSYIGKPLYYFSDFTYPALQNPFHSSLSMGTTFALNLQRQRIQRIGICNVSVQNIQITYANDGPPFAFKGLFGDRKDRWFTGDGVFNYYNNKWAINNLEAAYHKFTGWSANSFEASTDLGFTEVSYADTTQNKFITSLISFRALSTFNAINPGSDFGFSINSFRNSFGFGVNIYDTYISDVQHLIHFSRYFAHHVSPNPWKIGITAYGQQLYQPK